MTTVARLVTARPRLILLIGVAVALLCALPGADLSARVSVAGNAVPHSESARVDRFVTQHFGRQDPDVVVEYTARSGHSLADLGPAVAAAVARVPADLLAAPVRSYWNADPTRQPALRSADGRHALAVVFAAGDDNKRIQSYPAIAAALRIPGVDTRMSGLGALNHEVDRQSQHDLLLAESISLPVTLLVLVLVFGGLVAAALPVAVGVLAVLCAFGALRAVTAITEVSTFAVNIASLLSLGLAIDYGLFLVSRFREELAGSGHSTRDAVTVAYATAGRTVAFSATLLLCSFAGCLVFPQATLRSLAYGSMAATAAAAVLSLTVLPAALALLGPRIASGSRRADSYLRADARARRVWGSVVSRVLRRPGAVAAGVGAVLLGMAVLLGGVRLGDIDQTALPADNPTRQTTEQVAALFPAANSGATVLVTGPGGTAPSAPATAEITRRIEATPGVRAVPAPAAADDAVLVRAALTDPDGSTAAADTVARLRALAPVAGTTVRVGGPSADALDDVRATTARLPWMIAVMAIATVLLLVAAFGSIVLAVKAVAMALLSLAATFGLLTWIFQDGHGTGVLRAHQGPLAASMLVLIISVVFGLSTDYEVFLLSRIVEAHNAGSSTAAAVRAGTVGTARIITAAATLLILVTGAFALSPLTPMRFLGIGMIIALLLDATLVRLLLVPALVALLGPANWWTPGQPKRRHAATLAPPTPNHHYLLSDSS